MLPGAIPRAGSAGGLHGARWCRGAWVAAERTPSVQVTGRRRVLTPGILAEKAALETGITVSGKIRE